MSSPTVREGSGLDATVREGEPTATLREGMGADPGEPSESFVRLPRDLASRFVIERELPTRGNEADLLVVAPIEGGDRVVVKLYRAGVHPNVQQRVAGFDPSHVVRQIDSGKSQGRSFEVIEYAAEGSLADLVRAAPGGRLDDTTLRAMIEQVSAALGYLHSLDPPVVHRDVKPDNVLVRSREPLDLVLTDFGLASELDNGSSRASTLDRTIRYASPEASAGHVSRQMDWWSLGMMVAEASTGRHPFAGVIEQTISIHYVNCQPVPLDAVKDERVRLLCVGLLTYDRQQRWGIEEVQRWLAGDTTLKPPVAAPLRQAATPFKFARGTYGDVKGLAAAMVANWDAAKRAVARADALAKWLLDDAGEHEAWQWLSEIAEEKAQLDAGLKATLLLPMLDPDLPVIFEGEELTPERLLALVKEAAEGSIPTALPQLWEHLPALRDMTSRAARLAELESLVREARTAATESHTALTAYLSNLPEHDTAGWDFAQHVIARIIDPHKLGADQAEAQALLDRLADAEPDMAARLEGVVQPVSVGILWTLADARSHLEKAIDEALIARKHRETAEVVIRRQNELRRAGWELRFQAGHDYYHVSAALPLNGQYLVTGGGDNAARLWEIATGREMRVFTGHANDVCTIALSADGRHLITGSSDKTARLWDVATGRELRTFMGHTDSVHSVSLSPDGRHLVTGSWDKTARLWSVATGQELRVFSGHTDRVFEIALSADGRHLVTGSLDKTARLWDVATGRELRTFTGFTSSVDSVALSADGRLLVTTDVIVQSGTRRWMARLWEVATGRELGTFDGSSPLALSADGRLLVNRYANEARLWDVATRQKLRVFPSPAQGTRSLVLSPDGQSLVMAGYNGTVQLWDTATGHELRLLNVDRRSLREAANTRKISNQPWQMDAEWELRAFSMRRPAALSADEKLLVTCGDKIARLWNVATGQERRVFLGHTDRIASVALSADGRYLATASGDKTARLWSVATGQELRTFTMESSGYASVALSADGRRLVISTQKVVQIWDVETGQELLAHTENTNGYAIALSANGRHLVTAGGYDPPRLWSLATGEKLRTFLGHSSYVKSVVFSADARHLATASWDKTARLWDVETGRQLRLFEGHAHFVEAVALSADGRHLATGSWDGTARLWDLATGRELRKFRTHDKVTSVIFLAEGRHLVTHCNGWAGLWDVQSGKLLCSYVQIGDGALSFDGEGRLDEVQGDPDAMLHFVRGMDVLTVPDFLADADETWRLPPPEPIVPVIQAATKLSDEPLRPMEQNGASLPTGGTVASNGAPQKSMNEPLAPKTSKLSDMFRKLFE